MKKVCLISLFFYALHGFSQQESQFTNVMINPYLINPGAVGLYDVAQAEVGGRYQWLGYDGGPQTYFASFNTQLNRQGRGNQEYNIEHRSFYNTPQYSVGKNKHVIGARAYSDNIGIFNKSAVYGTYAYHLPFTDKVNFGLGISAGIGNFSVNESKVNLYQQDDQAYNDFLSGGGRQTVFDVQSGFVFYGQKFLIGLSGTQLLKNAINLNNITTESVLARHLFVHGNFRLISEEHFALEPNFVLKLTSGAPASFDIGARFIFQKSLWASLTYRTSNAAVVGLGINLVENLYIAYAYELATGQIRGANSGTHQVQLGIYIGRNRAVKKELKESGKDAKSDAE